MTLECFSIGEMAPALLREVEDFLDSQDTGHPFQYPHWAGSRARVMLIREHGKICWLGTFVVQGPLGRRFPWIRALVANRGPVCDDSHFWQNAAEKLADMLREEKFTYLDVLPEWLCQADHDHPTFANHSKWRCVGKDRASLRLDLKQSEDDIFANFRKISRYEVRRAERLGATVLTASSETEIEEFLSIYQRMAIRKGFAPDPIDNLRRNIHWLISSESRGSAPHGKCRRHPSWRSGDCSLRTKMLVYLGRNRTGRESCSRPPFAVEGASLGKVSQLQRI